MKKALIVLSLTILGQAPFAYAATDWTPYLEPMMSGCDFPNPVYYGIPQPYKSAVVNKEVTNPSDSYEEKKLTTYKLKESVAFGYPLIKIAYLQGYDAKLQLYFENNDFMALRSEFKLPKEDDPRNMSMFINENNENGYYVEGTEHVILNFDNKDKSISCYKGI